MIIETILKPIFSFISMLFNLINVGKLSFPGWIGDTLDLLSKALMFFPVDVYVIVIANIVFWLTIQLGWAVIEWVYKKIPGIN